MNLAEIETFLTIVNTKSYYQNRRSLISFPAYGKPPLNFSGKRARIFSGYPQQGPQAGRAHTKGNGFYHPRRTLDVSLERNT